MDNSIMELSERIKTARKHAGLTQKELADRLKIQQGTISDLERGKQKKCTFVASLADVLGVRPLWLEDEEGPMLADKRTGNIPLLDWSQVIDYLQSDAPLEQSAALDWIDPGTPTSTKAFALRVQGDTMQPRFTPGLILVIDPSIPASPDNYVIAHEAAQTVTFKQLTQDGQDLYLRPENDRYPIKPLGDTEIVGVVIKAIMTLL